MLKKTRRIVYIALVAVVVLAIIGAVCLLLFYTPRCQNYECWQEKMTACSKVSFINDESEASWMYEVKGKEGGKCAISVKLLLAKQGELGINKLIGQEMTCYYSLGTAAYAEKDLSKCHGLLKEELQTIIINKLHAYIIENLGKVEEGLEKAA